MSSVLQSVGEWFSWFTRDRLLVIIPAIIAVTGLATFVTTRLDK